MEIHDVRVSLIGHLNLAEGPLCSMRDMNSHPMTVLGLMVEPDSTSLTEVLAVML